VVVSEKVVTFRSEKRLSTTMEMQLNLLILVSISLLVASFNQCTVTDYRPTLRRQTPTATSTVLTFLELSELSPTTTVSRVSLLTPTSECIEFSVAKDLLLTIS
jgi:hypothetical protein